MPYRPKNTGDVLDVFTKTSLHAFIHWKDKTAEDRVVMGAKRGKGMQMAPLIQVTGTQRGINAPLWPLLSGGVLRRMTHGGPNKGR